MKVVYVIPGMRGAGGAERSLAAMAPYLAREIDLHVVTYTGRTQLRPELEAAGATLTDISCAHPPWGALPGLRDIIGDLRPDIVHTTLIEADLIGRVASASQRTPVVSSLVNDNHGLSTLRTSPRAAFRRAGYWAADAATAQGVSRFHALTEHVATIMGRRLRVPQSRIDVIPRGRSSSALGTRASERRLEARALLGVGDEVLVMAAARHEHQKGLDILIRAAALVHQQNPKVRFVIGGRDGNQTSELRELQRSLGLLDKIEWIGQRDDLPDLMCAADVWCVPSRWEGLGGVLIEAMALQVPTVASAVPAIREVAGTPPCFELVPPGDAEALARGLLSVISSPDSAAQRAQRGRERFLEEFTAESVTGRMVAFYERAVEGSRLAGRR